MHAKRMMNHNDQLREESVISHRDFFRVAIEGRNRMCHEFKKWVVGDLITEYLEPKAGEKEEKINPILDFYILTHKKI